MTRPTEAADETPLRTPLQATAVPELDSAERDLLGGGARFDNFALYARHSSPATELFWVKVCAGDRVVAAAPTVRLPRRKTTDMLRSSLRRWLGPVLGPLARKTTMLVDTSFLAYDDQSPFFVAPGVDRTAVKQAVSAYLKAQKGVDSIWIAEPPEESAWAAREAYAQFQTLPMVHVELGGFSTADEYLASLSKKRRRNYRHERAAFDAAGAAIETHVGPLGDRAELVAQLLGCLNASAAHSQFTVPYNDVLIEPHAFAEQPQTALVARVGEQVVGFMSFFVDGDRLLQCHGGLDYVRSHQVYAYHNLIYAAIELAIRRDCRLMSMGPLNNETKRRAGGVLRPVVASLWNRNPIDRLVANALFIKNFEVYRGAPGDALQLGAD